MPAPAIAPLVYRALLWIGTSVVAYFATDIAASVSKAVVASSEADAAAVEDVKETERDPAVHKFRIVRALIVGTTAVLIVFGLYLYRKRR